MWRKLALTFFGGYHVSQVKCPNEMTIGLLLTALQCGAQTLPKASVGVAENAGCGDEVFGVLKELKQ